MSALVEESCGVRREHRLDSSGMILTASCLPSSTPHWSKESMLPDRALDEDRVLVEGDERTEEPRGELVGEQHVRGAVALHDPVRDDALVGALGTQLGFGLAKGQRLGLGEDVGHQDVVVVPEWIEAVGESDEVDGNHVVP